MFCNQIVFKLKETQMILVWFSTIVHFHFLTIFVHVVLVWLSARLISRFYLCVKCVLLIVQISMISKPHNCIELKCLMYIFLHYGSNICYLFSHFEAFRIILMQTSSFGIFFKYQIEKNIRICYLTSCKEPNEIYNLMPVVRKWFKYFV